MQPRARVLAVAQSADLGGAELALLRIARRLPQHGIEVELTVPGPGRTADAAEGGPHQAGAHQAGAHQAGAHQAGAHRGGPHPAAAHPAAAHPAGAIPWHRLPVGGLRAGAWPAAVAAWPRARRLARGFDAVLLNGIVTQRLAPAMRGTTLVPYIHEIADSPPRAWSSARFWHAAPLVLCACDAVAQRCRALGAPPDRLRTVYAPVEVEPPSERPDWADWPVVGYVGRIEPAKGTLDLVRAMARVDAHLVLIGDGEGAYADQVRREADERTHVLGRMGDPRPLLHWFDVLAVPSHREAFGTVAAEALAAGTPVVATRSGGVEEYVIPGRNGDLVLPGDSEALARAISALLPKAASMADAARADAKRFAADRVAAAVAESIHEAIARRA